jgi:hypothetical protein
MNAHHTPRRQRRGPNTLRMAAPSVLCVECGLPTTALTLGDVTQRVRSALMLVTAERADHSHAVFLDGQVLGTLSALALALEGYCLSCAFARITPA